MATIMKRIRQSVTVDDLREAGFTTEQIERLELLRSYYPCIEFIDSNRQWNRLILMKWLYTAGKIDPADH